MTEYSSAIRTLKRWTHEDQLINDEVEAESVIAGLKPGYNYLTPDQFSAVTSYLYLDDDVKRSKAMVSGACKVGGGIELIRVDWMKREHMFSVSELSRISGIERTKLSRWLHSQNLPAQIEGTKKLYDIRMIRDYLDNHRNDDGPYLDDPNVGNMPPTQ